VGISSVVPDLTAVYETMARKFLNAEPVTVSGSLDLGIRIDYRDPSAVGADRICNAIAGFARYGGPLIINRLRHGHHIRRRCSQRGLPRRVITLGLESMAAELHRRAAKLPKIELRFPASVIGKDTQSSMQAGVMFGTVDAVEGAIRRIRESLDAGTVIATGGLAGVVAEHTRLIEAVEPALVLDGIRRIWEEGHAPHLNLPPKEPRTRRGPLHHWHGPSPFSCTRLR